MELAGRGAGVVVGKQFVVHDLARLGVDDPELEGERSLLLLQPEDILSTPGQNNLICIWFSVNPGIKLLPPLLAT